MTKKKKKNLNSKEENDEELWAEIYFLRSKAYINMNKIESGLNDINKFFELIDKEKNKIEENLNKGKNKEKKNNNNNYDIEKILYQKYKIKENLDKVKNNKNNKDNNKGKGEYDIEKILYQKYDISDAHFKRGFCYFNLFDYNSALKEFESAIKLDPNYTTVYSYIKTCKRKINKINSENNKDKEEIEKEKNEIIEKFV